MGMDLRSKDRAIRSFADLPGYGLIDIVSDRLCLVQSGRRIDPGFSGSSNSQRRRSSRCCCCGSSTDLPATDRYRDADGRNVTGRTLDGKKEKASRGGFAGEAAPLGYKRDLRGGLVIDDAESAIVRQIVTMRAAGCSLRVIATTLNDAACVPKRGKRFSRAQSTTCLTTRNTGA
jgi:hypothetical protein